jgi:hypothetical protein
MERPSGFSQLRIMQWLESRAVNAGRELSGLLVALDQRPLDFLLVPERSRRKGEDERNSYYSH